MNNSLAPIKSIAGSLEGLLRRDPPPADWRDDARSGLNVIASRAESLSRFMVTHDARFAQHADRTIHLFDGRVVEDKIAA